MSSVRAHRLKRKRQDSPVEEVAAAHSGLPHAEIEQVEMTVEPVLAGDLQIILQSLEGGGAAFHDVTSIHATGEMVSAAPVSDPVEVEASQQAFEPGADVVEVEEAIDDQDYDSTMLHASSIEELDDLDEEETLEGAADLGTMIREMSIDQITSSNLEDEEDDLFEEEDAIDDASFTSVGAEYAVAEEEDDAEEELIQDEFAEEGESAPIADGAVASPERSREFDRRRGRRDRRGRDRGGRHGAQEQRNGGRAPSWPWLHAGYRSSGNYRAVEAGPGDPGADRQGAHCEEGSPDYIAYRVAGPVPGVYADGEPYRRLAQDRVGR